MPKNKKMMDKKVKGAKGKKMKGVMNKAKKRKGTK
jgi:hypothetical protein